MGKWGGRWCKKCQEGHVRPDTETDGGQHWLLRGVSAVVQGAGLVLTGDSGVHRTGFYFFTFLPFSPYPLKEDFPQLSAFGPLFSLLSVHGDVIRVHNFNSYSIRLPHLQF